MANLASIYGLTPTTPTRPVVDGTPGTGVLGFLGNLWHDAQNMVVGIGQLGGQAVHDVGRGIATTVNPILPGEDVSLGFIDSTDPTGYHIPKIIEELPEAILHDYAHRYGGASNITEGLYKHPLSYILDALGAGSALGKGAEITGALALKAPEAAPSLARAGEVAQELRGAGVAEGAVRGASLRAGLEDLATKQPLTGLQEAALRTLPKQTVRRVGEHLVPYAQANNPVTRAMTYPLRRAASESLDVLKNEASVIGDRVAEFAAGGDTTNPEYLTAVTRLDQIRSLVTGAEEAGLKRISKPFVSDVYEKLAMKKLVGFTRGTGYSAREGRAGEALDILKPYYSADDTFVDRAAGSYQSLNVTVPQLPQDVGAVNVDGMVLAPKTVHLTNPADVPPPTLDLAPQMREWAAKEGTVAPMLARADYAKEQAARLLQRAADDPAQIEWRLPHMPEGQQTPEAYLAREQDAAARMLSGGYDSVSRRVEHINPQSDFSLSDVVKSQDDLRMMLMDDKWQGAALERGDLNYDQIMERAYRTVALKHNAKWIDGQLRYVPAGEDVALYRNGALPAESLKVYDWRELDDAFRAAGAPQPIYYPLMDEQKLANVHSYADFVMSNARVGARRATADRNLRFMSGDLLESGGYVKDPILAYVRRGARMSRAEELQNLMEWAIKPQGRLISSLDEKLDNESYYIPDALRRTWRQKIGFEDTVQSLRDEGVEVDKAVADGIQSVIFKDQDAILNQGVTTKGVEIYAIPKNLADVLDSYSKYALNNKYIKFFWDGPMNAWRGFVLQGSPRWTLNNLLGNTTMAKLSGGANVTDVLAIGAERLRRGIAEKMGSDFDSAILDQLSEVEGIGRVSAGAYASDMNLYTARLGAAELTPEGKLYQRLAGANPVQLAKTLASKNARANGAIESWSREAGYVKALEKQDLLRSIRPHIDGMWNLRSRLERLNGRTITEVDANAALNEMNKVFGNFAGGALGPIERNVIRRFLAPFWGFTKHQATFLARMPFNNPIRAEVIRLTHQINQEMMQQFGPLPSWLEGAIPMAGPGPGEIPFMSTRGANPFNASFQPATSMLSPPIQLALSRIQGEDLYTGEPYSDPNVTTAFGSDTPYRKVYDENGNVVDVKPLDSPVVPGLLEQLLSTLPQYEMAESLAAGGDPYDTANLPSIIASRVRGEQEKATQFNPATRQPYSPASVADALTKFLGIGTYDVDLQSYQRSEILNRLRALAAAQAGR